MVVWGGGGEWENIARGTIPALPDYYFTKSRFLPYNLKKIGIKEQKAVQPYKIHRVKYFLMFINVNTNLQLLKNIIFFRNIFVFGLRFYFRKNFFLVPYKIQYMSIAS